MKKIFLSALLSVMVQLLSVAQNDIQFSHYMFSEITYNPAMAGSSGTLDAALFFRQQWTGFAQAPQTQLVSVQTNIEKASGGIGLNIINDKLGFERSINFKLMYAYVLRLSTVSRLSFGLGFGMLNKSLQGSKLTYDDMTDQNAVYTDQSKTKADFDFGIAYNSDKMAIGLSVEHIEQPLKNANDLAVPRHLYLYAKYKIKANEKINVIPSLLLKSTLYITQLDITAQMFYSNIFWVGASLRTGDAIVGMAGIDVTKKIRIGYSFDYNSGSLKSNSGGSHEIILIGTFDVARRLAPSKSRRFFN
jgi:type IX secretion system PorP/SprF family membrane protein